MSKFIMNKNYCTIPWTEVHIDNDGAYRSCGSQYSQKTVGSAYNVFNMSIEEWMSSEYQLTARQNKLDGIAEPLCRSCYQEDEIGADSKRSRELLKYPIIPEEYLIPTLAQLPRSYHLLLGNECNLACKMCHPKASSRLAFEWAQRGEWPHAIRQNWTGDEEAWRMVIDTMLRAEKLEYVHLIGGEPLVNPRVGQLIDTLYKAGRTDIYIGFTTNATIFDKKILDQLQAFRHVDIGVSVDATGDLNDFIRTGSNTEQILNNIEKYLSYRDPGHVYVVLRTVPSALSVHGLDKLYQWAIEKELDVMSTFLDSPSYLTINQLPANIKDRLLEQYSHWQYSDRIVVGNNRDPNYYKEHIDNEVRGICKMLERPNDPVLTEELYKRLKDWGAFDLPEIQKYFFTD